MSDYLSNLAIRSWGAIKAGPDPSTATIQPRLISLFEPPRASGRLVSEPHTGLEGSSVSSMFDGAFDEIAGDETLLDALRRTQPLAGPPSAHHLDEPSRTADWPHRMGLLHERSEDWRTRVGGRTGQSMAQPSPMYADLQRAESGLERASTQPSPDLPPQILRRRAARPSAVKAPPQPGQDLPSSPSSAALDEPAPPAHIVAQPLQPVVDPVTQRISVERAGSSKKPELGEARDEFNAVLPGRAIAQLAQPGLEPAIQHIVTERIATLEEQQPSPTELFSSKTTRSSAFAPIIVQPRVTPAMPAASAPGEPTSGPQPAPTIQVTIGRIEVRATPPSAPPQNRRPAPAVLGLDEYLNRRVRGGGDR